MIMHTSAIHNLQLQANQRLLHRLSSVYVAAAPAHTDRWTRGMHAKRSATAGVHESIPALYDYIQPLLFCRPSGGNIAICDGSAGHLRDGTQYNVCTCLIMQVIE